MRQATLCVNCVVMTKTTRCRQKSVKYEENLRLHAAIPREVRLVEQESPSQPPTANRSLAPSSTSQASSLLAKSGLFLPFARGSDPVG